ncbi:UDPglucose 6-dehydrogenase/UDP-N-acetyl-D-galactosamine dehydrogenase [Methanocalculus sp. AMF5]|uniref:nucleotide sugar dehydrogenase n=1 Tax=Methanocalculus sp. AMF5 TaxID=1198257 RepID=UPI00209D6E77|nr:nucleotide sugar dehydrogenase [Methanocalculus sp. AMF5]MCP1663258.1 UDPglucose 6-dehydrogenase/UDP-N-acetyl-D-galactosamine dehydrogenase [Methanocalculus sp. AMF5]
MVLTEHPDPTVCVVGLGYVGYPLACAFAEKIQTIGYDVDAKKIAAINATPGNLIEATTDPALIREADVVIIAVPTPVTKAKDPDISYIVSAGETVGKQMKAGAIVVLESTVYPGLTEEVFVPVLERASGLVCGRDFFVGYSPERINPGDDEHTLEKITKVVAGMDAATAETLAALYGRITTVHLAPDIRTAEAAKVIENVQRDLNIALMNELSIIFGRMGIDTRAVLEAAATKWNFHRYRPGLVGGHCIPVDPYYLVMKAEELGYHPQVILAGRAINDAMPRHVAQLAIKELNRAGKVIKGSRLLIMGLTYKENVPDTRESPVEEMIRELKEFEVEVYGYDPLLGAAEIEHFGALPVASLGEIGDPVDCIVINVPHSVFSELTLEKVCGICNGKPIVVDVTGMLRGDDEVRDGCVYRVL